MTNPVHQYARDVIAGRVLAGELVRLACERHLTDLETGSERGLRFHWPEAQRALGFMAVLHYWKQGRWSRGRKRCTCNDGVDAPCPQMIHWLPWQVFFFGSVYGWQRRDDDGTWCRRFRTIYLQVSRKNGKTTLGNAIVLRSTFGEGEDKAEGYVIAVGKDQARYVHNIGKELVKASPRLRERLEGFELKLANVYNPETGCFYEPLASETNTLDSRGPHVALIDEYHEHPSAKARKDLTTGMGGGTQPLEVIITTAGLRVVGSPCKELRDYSERVIRGIQQNDSLFSMVYELDEGDDWADPALFEKDNPSIGQTVFAESLLSDLEEAKADPEAELHYRTKRRNQWVGSSSTYLPMEDWSICGRLPVDLESLRGRRCFGGIDLASMHDLNALVLVFPPDDDDGIWYSRQWFWIPERMLHERAKRDQTVRNWTAAGLIEVTPGVETDYEAIRARVNEQADLYQIEQVGFDPWNAGTIPHRLIDDGLEVQKVPQNMANLSAATKKLKVLVRGHRLAFGAHQVMSWCASNATVIVDTKENMMVSKKHSADRVDGIAAGVIALALALDYTSEDELGVGIVA